MPYIKIHNSTPKGGNKGSSERLMNYLEKEGRGDFFDHERRYIEKHETVHHLDNNKAKLSKKDDKFFMVSINPSQKEIAHMKKSSVDMKKSMMDYTRKVMDEYAKNFNREGIKSGADLVYYAKVEKNRYYNGDDKAVVMGKAKSGDKKPGENWHVHVVVSRKDRTNKIKLSPAAKERKSSNRTIGKNKYKVGFDRALFKLKSEQAFDMSKTYYRDPQESVKNKLQQALRKSGVKNPLESKIGRLIKKSVL